MGECQFIRRPTARVQRSPMECAHARTSAGHGRETHTRHIGEAVPYERRHAATRGPLRRRPPEPAGRPDEAGPTKGRDATARDQSA